MMHIRDVIEGGIAATRAADREAVVLTGFDADRVEVDRLLFDAMLFLVIEEFFRRGKPARGEDGVRR